MVTQSSEGSIRLLDDGFGIVNLLRVERGLPKASRQPKVTSLPTRVTRQMVKDICIQVWKDQYPQALTDADFELGEMTAKLVEQ